MIAVVVWRLLVGGYEEAIGFYRMCSYWAGDSTDLLNHSRSIRHNLFVAVLPDINFPLPFPKEKNYFTLLVTGFLKSTAIHHGGDNEQSCHLPQAEQCPGSLQAVVRRQHCPLPVSIYPHADCWVWYGTFFWSVGVSCPTNVPSSYCSLLARSLGMGAECETQKASMLCKQCSATAKWQCVTDTVSAKIPDTAPYCLL